MAGIVGKWHEIAKEGYPKTEEVEYRNMTSYLLTDGREYYIGFWRADANAWDNLTTGWVRRYYDPIGSDTSLAHITHWMELPNLPITTEDMFDEMRDFTFEEEEAYQKSIEKLYKPIGVNIWEF